MTMPVLDSQTCADISALITVFFHCLDTGEIENVADMFTADAPLDMGVVGRPGTIGPSGVSDTFGKRTENRTVRHHWSNLHVRSTGDEVDAVFQFATYVGASDTVAPPSSVTIGDVEVRMRPHPLKMGWQFAAMKRNVVFVT